MRIHLPRRAFAISLRTLFVVLTLFCLWLGYHVSAVRERHAVMKMLEARGGLWRAPPNLMFPGPQLSMSRRLLGDVPLQKNFFLGRNENFTDADLLRIWRAFPEAEEVMISKKEKILDEANVAEPWPLLESIRASESRYYIND